jgi:hypothetical protein
MKEFVVSEDKWRDAVKFLMGLGTGPSLSAGEQEALSGLLRLRKTGDGFSAANASRLLFDLGWVRKGTKQPAMFQSYRDFEISYEKDGRGEHKYVVCRKGGEFAGSYPDIGSAKNWIDRQYNGALPRVSSSRLGLFAKGESREIKGRNGE